VRAYISDSQAYSDRALEQWLFGQAALTLATGVALVYYFLMVEGRNRSQLSDWGIGFVVLAAAPALAAARIRRRRAHG
jgi:hypothetical protein